MADSKQQQQVKVTDAAGEPIFNIKRNGSMVSWMNDDGTKGAASKTEFARKYKTEAEWDVIYKEAQETKQPIEDVADAYQAQDNNSNQTIIDEASEDEVINPVETVQAEKTGVQEYTEQLIKAFNLDIPKIKVAVAGRTDVKVNQALEVELTLPRKFWDEAAGDSIKFAQRVVHELVHIANLRLGFKDTCGNGAYHNDVFKAAAHECALTAEFTRGQGWGNTHLTATSTFSKIANKLPVPYLPDYVQAQVAKNQELKDRLTASSQANLNLHQRVTDLEDEVKELKEQVAQLLLAMDMQK